tara:strand:- start:24 stop:1661 length:1638 start_codon:yes stop_codon:yes gene_type:complete
LLWNGSRLDIDTGGTEDALRIGSSSGADTFIRLGSTGTTADTHAVLKYDVDDNYVSLLVSGESHGNGGILIANGGAVSLSAGTSPSAKLHVKEDVYVKGSSGDGSVGIQIRSGGSALSNQHQIRTGGGTGEQIFVEALGSSSAIVTKTAGSERLRITAAGNVGIGDRTTSPDELLHVHTASGEAKIHVEAATNARVRIRAHSGESIVQFADSGSSNPGEINYTHSSDSMSFRTGGSVRSIIDSSGNMVIGDSSADARLHVHSSNHYVLTSSGVAHRHIHCSAVNGNAGEYGGAISFGMGSTGAAAVAGVQGAADADNVGLSFITHNSGTGSADATEMMRLHSTGALSVGTSPSATYWGTGTAAFFESTSQNTVTISHSGTNNNYPLTVRNNRVNASTGGYMLYFLGASAVEQGSIISNNGATSYNSGSDYRLKENITDISDGITRVKQLQPRRFNWISDENKTVQDGFIAHEIQSVIPEVATGTKDEVVTQEGLDKGSYHQSAEVGQNVYQSVDYGKITPLLTAALKEAIAKIETLETKVAALEG